LFTQFKAESSLKEEYTQRHQESIRKDREAERKRSGLDGTHGEKIAQNLSFF
jgi:hypothetical protein